MPYVRAGPGRRRLSRGTHPRVWVGAPSTVVPMSFNDMTQVSGKTLRGRGASTRRTREVPVIAVIGNSRLGRRALSLELAKTFSGELICADSLTIHEELSLGVAKPLPEDQSQVPHFGLNMVALGSFCSGPEFAAAANEWVADISSRGHVAIVCGESELFVNAALYSLVFATPESDVRWVEEDPLEWVYARFWASGVELPLNWRDRDILKLAWQRNRVECVGELRRPTLVLSPVIPEEFSLRKRLVAYVDELIERGLEDEVYLLCGRHGRGPDTLCSIGYSEWEGYFEGEVTLAAVKERIVENALQAALRQENWVAHTPGVVRVGDVAQAVVEVLAFLDAYI